MDKTKKSFLRKAIEALTFAVSDLKFEAHQLKDSEEMIDITSKEVGADVMVSSSDGSEVAPNGEYELADGFKFKVEDGKISEITTPDEVPSDKVEEEMSEDDTAAEEVAGPDYSKEIEDLKKEVEDLKAIVEGLVGTVGEVQTGTEDFANAVNDKFSKMVTIPVEESKVSKTQKNEFSKEVNKLVLSGLFKKK